MKKYKASNGASFGNKKAQIYGLQLEKIKKEKGKLKPQYVIEDAKKVDSPLHDHFEWDDSKASEKYRLYQARLLISGIMEIVVIDKTPKEMKSFFNIKHDKDNEQVYITIKEASTNNNYKEQVLNQLIKELEYVTDLMKTFKKI